MQKDFITVTPDSGNSGEVSVEADMNPQFKGRETTLTFSATGALNKSVKAIQIGIPYIPILPVRGIDLTKLGIGSDGELIYEINFTNFDGEINFIGGYSFFDVTSQIETIQGELYTNNEILIPKEESKFEFSESGGGRIWVSSTILYFLLAATQNPDNIKGNNSYLKVWINGKLAQNITLTK